MAKVFCVDDYRAYAEMVAGMLATKGGHTVKTDIVPLDLEDVIDFDPDVVVVNLVRKSEALRSAIHDFDTEVDGAKALRAIASDPRTAKYPLILTALAVDEGVVPKGIPYVAFLEIPQRLESLLPTIAKTVAVRQAGHDAAPR